MHVDPLRRNAVHVAGAGPSILFAHGFGTDQHMWRQVLPGFSDYRVITFDHVGWGRSLPDSDHAAKYKSLADYAGDIVELARRLHVQGGIFVGHSIGALMAVHVAREAPELFEAFVMIGASACYVNDGDYRGGFERETLRELMAHLSLDQDTWAGEVAKLAASDPKSGQAAVAFAENLKVADKAMLRRFAELTFFLDLREEVRGLDKPVLLLQAHDDPVVPLSAATALCRSMPQCTFEMLDAKGHFPHETNPQAIVRAIRGYLDR
jgi:sigma-B regulation protein RsbQ